MNLDLVRIKRHLSFFVVLDEQVYSTIDREIAIQLLITTSTSGRCRDFTFISKSACLQYTFRFSYTKDENYMKKITVL